MECGDGVRRRGAPILPDDQEPVVPQMGGRYRHVRGQCPGVVAGQRAFGVAEPAQVHGDHHVMPVNSGITLRQKNIDLGAPCSR